MKTFSQDQLWAILDAHSEWVKSGGQKGDRANLAGANLAGAYLFGANLERANLKDAHLHCANLERANLFGANLYRAKLVDANLHCANLERANLEGTILEKKEAKQTFVSSVKSENTLRSEIEAIANKHGMKVVSLGLELL